MHALDDAAALGAMRTTHAVPAWAVGLALGVVGYSACGFGLNLIKLSHVKASGAPASLAPTRWNRRGSRAETRALWAAGYAFNALGGSLNLCGLRFAAQSLLAPLSSVALVANLVFATAMLGERFCAASDVLPLLMIVGGNVVAVLSASHRPQEALTLAEISALFVRPQFRAYLVAVVVAASCLMLLRARLRARIRRDGGPDFACPTLTARAGLCHTAAAALLSVNTVFLSKASVLVLADGLGNALQPQFCALFFTWLCLATFWIYTLNRLLASHDLLFVVPAIEVSWSCMSLVSGGIFFREYAGMSGARIASFVAGVALNFLGILLLSRRGEKASKIG